MLCINKRLYSADSVFCSHGAGVLVPWDEVPEHMHLPSALERGPSGRRCRDGPRALPTPGPTGEPRRRRRSLAIFERSYGPVRDITQASRVKRKLRFTPPRRALKQWAEFLYSDITHFRQGRARR